MERTAPPSCIRFSLTTPSWRSVNSIGSTCTSRLKFLLDNCVPPAWAIQLRRVGFHVLDGKDVPRPFTMPLDDDCLYLIYRDTRNRILLTCDDLNRGGKLASLNTGYRIGAELRQRGGQTVTVGTAPSGVTHGGQAAFLPRAVGEPFFGGGPGKVELGKVGSARSCPTCGLAIDETPGDYREKRPDRLPHLQRVETAQGRAYLAAMKQLGLEKKRPRGKPFSPKPVAPTIPLGGEDWIESVEKRPSW